LRGDLKRGGREARGQERSTTGKRCIREKSKRELEKKKTNVTAKRIKEKVPTGKDA